MTSNKPAESNRMMSRVMPKIRQAARKGTRPLQGKPVTGISRGFGLVFFGRSLTGMGIGLLYLVLWASDAVSAQQAVGRVCATAAGGHAV
jgi:hypothetical protein